jgi:uncharacterized protein
MISVRENDIIANFYTPKTSGRFPTIITIGGSMGGIDHANYYASQLVGAGYAALALAYFGMDHLPSHLEEIPLEYFKNAIDWLHSNSLVDPEKIGILGVSKGGEAALLIGATYDAIRNVIAVAPSHASFQSIDGRWFEKARPKPSWTLNDKPVPYIPYQVDNTYVEKYGFLLGLYIASLQDQRAVERATIHVEKINSPILLLSGKDDTIWPSSMMCDLIIERLKQHHFPFPYQHISYDNAGHDFIFRRLTQSSKKIQLLIWVVQKLGMLLQVLMLG